MLLRFYRTPILGAPQGVKTEWCYYLQVSSPLAADELERLKWLLSETFEPKQFSQNSFLSSSHAIAEVGPRLNFETAWSTTAVSILRACGLTKVQRIERSRRYGFANDPGGSSVRELVKIHHDRMTEMEYPEPLETFAVGAAPKSIQIIPVIEQGLDALQEANLRLGQSMDDQDLAMYLDLAVKKLHRNFTDVEFCQLGQANSEHSRHHFFKGQLVIDGQVMPHTLMDIVKTPWLANPRQSLIAFGDDSSAMRGYRIKYFTQRLPGRTSQFEIVERFFHPTLTAETHNHPTGIEPYEGAMTGGGGRIRDNQMVGQGALVIASGAAYCVGNLHIPGYELPWESDSWSPPDNLAAPLDILIKASNGASDYGNCFGEPIIFGFTRTFGMELLDGYRSWYKPIMYTVGAGQIDDAHTEKTKPVKGMLVVQVGGPSYRIGIGGGSASSMISGANEAELDFNSVQRGDPQMEQKVNRLIRACVEMGDNNPIVTGHDLGAGGDCNALPELVEPAGARINLRAIPVGDVSLSTLEIWCNESQERNAFLIWPDKFDWIKKICEREGVPLAIVGQVTGDGYLILHDDNDGSEPVNLPLEHVLGSIPQKIFDLSTVEPKRTPLVLPDSLTVREALDRVLRLVSVGSKRFLTTKVDRSVSGLIVQQQCVGPNHLTLSDYAVIAQSYFGLTGVALSLGEQPIKGLISPEAMARMSVAEALLNMVGAKITDLEDIKCSANWMLAAKEPGEGAWLYRAAMAMRDIMLKMGIAIDGGKDSLSMAAKVTRQGIDYVVKAPGELVIANYATMDDVSVKVTPDLKKAGNELLFIDLADESHRLGGSALAQVFGQVGDDCPDADADTLISAFQAVQELVKQGNIAAVHDRSDGGLITTLLEMAYAGNFGVNITMQTEADPIPFFFNEELGLVIECNDSDAVHKVLDRHSVQYEHAGWVTNDLQVTAYLNGELVLSEPMIELRSVWESTSSAIDRQSANPESVEEESRNNHGLLKPPPYHLSFHPKPPPDLVGDRTGRPSVAILRERGSNGDREMAAAFYLAGFDVQELIMDDLIKGQTTLDQFRGLVFPGGFSFADVLDAGKGWAGVIRFNEKVSEQFERFYQRSDTFSFGVCNGCQLMALLGWVPWQGIKSEQQPRFIRNCSGRFESRFSCVSIESSPSMMLQGMSGSRLGVWVAHGEGQFLAPDSEMLQDIISKELAPIRYVGPQGLPTRDYPFNPNGSVQGIAALCSPDGRHLAMMPHPERTFLLWQWPWLPADWQSLSASPWLQLFRNAFTWCQHN